MGIDLKRTYFERTDSTPIVTGSSVTEEGQGLVAVLEGGIEKVKPSVPAAGEKFAGFASFRQLDYSTAPNVESAAVPATAPYEIQLAANNLIVGQIRVHDVAGNVDMTPFAAPHVPAAGEVTVDYAAGKLTFNAAQAGLVMKSYYRFNLTVAQAQALYQQAATNYPNANLFGQCGVGKGKSRLYTAFYDASVDWSDPSVVIKLGANGLIVNGGIGPAVPGARVVKVPDVGVAVTSSSQMLGIEFIA